MACPHHRDTWTCHAAVRGCLPRLLRGLHVIESGSVRFCSQCLCVRVWCLRVSLKVCVSIISPRRDPVDCRSCPVVVTVPGAASGTIWPPWKSSAGATSEQACKRKRDEDYCRTDSTKQHRSLVLTASCWRCERGEAMWTVKYWMGLKDWLTKWG